MKKINVQTDRRDDMIDVTHEVLQYVKETGIQNGTVIVYCPHTTAGITINENADPDVKWDMLRRLEELFPWKHPKDRHMEGNTAAHMKASYMGASQHVLIHDGDLVLGTWQGIYFCEFDGPRQRHFYVQVMSNE
ncbi:secondary thiamine-phosphate synthase enzyme YjbQ [Bacillus safensis]